MANNNLRNSCFTRGEFLEITKEIDCIPAGKYLFEGQDELYYHFAISDSAVFGISVEYKHLLAKVLGEKDQQATSASDFIMAYHSLLREKAKRQSRLPAAKVYCAIDPAALVHLTHAGLKFRKVR